MIEKHVIIPIFVPHKGCPHDCIFCNQRKISGQTEEMSVEKIHQIIQSHLITIKANSNIEIAFYGGSFTGIEKVKQLVFLEAAFEYVKSGKIESIRLSTRPDYIEDDILEYLKTYGVKTIELGVQSLDEDVLKASNRGHTPEDVYKASGMIKRMGFILGIQTMTGLPLDTKEKDMFTAKEIARLKPDFVRIYPVLVIKGTYLETLYIKGDYTPQEVDEAVDICSGLLEFYDKLGISVIRIGLQPSDNINEGSDVVAGPFHPAFRQLVESRLALKKIEKEIIGQNLMNSSQITIVTAKCNISNLIGQRRTNIDKIKSDYGIKSIKISASENCHREIVVLPY